MITDRGDDSEESDNLFSDCSSDEYHPDNKDYDGSDVDDVDRQQKKRKLQKKAFQQLENAIHIGTGNNDTFIQTNYTIQNDERNLVVTDENHPNNEELQEIPNTQAVRQKKKHFSPKLKVTEETKKSK